MFNWRKITIIGLVVILIVALLFLFLMIFKGKPKEEPIDANQPNSDIARQLEQLPPPVADSYPLALKQLAFSFAERYGSYSNEVNFKNLADLKPLMTLAMQQKVDAIIRAGEAAGSYAGINTRALSSELVSSAGNKTAIMIKTQREKMTGSPVQAEIFYQDLLLNFVKAGEEWLVDGAEWK